MTVLESCTKNESLNQNLFEYSLVYNGACLEHMGLLLLLFEDFVLTCIKMTVSICITTYTSLIYFLSTHKMLSIY